MIQIEKNENLVESIVSILNEKKAIDVFQAEIPQDKIKLSDFCIIASGSSSRHAQGLADHIYRFLKNRSGDIHIEGNAKSGWILIDSSGIEIHIFKPELRNFYNIEELIL